LGTKAAPKLDIPECAESKVFRTFEHILKEDYILGSVTELLIAYHDSDDSLYEPAWTYCPFLALTPFPSEGVWLTEGQHAMPLRIHIKVAVRGLDVTNLFNYWALIRTALFPQTVAAVNAIQTLFANACAGSGGVMTKPTLQMNGYGPMIDDKGMRLLVAEGVVQFGMNIFT
jgi:hypothetical protein